MARKLKEKVKKIVQQRNLCSYMNDTKWSELRHAMLYEMPFPPPYILKFLFEEEAVGEKYFHQDVNYLGGWEDGFLMHNAFAVEWIKIRPRYLKFRGQLLEPEVIQAESELIKILKKYSIPYEENEGVYCIYGYR